jgi:hypothetical protein
MAGEPVGYLRVTKLKWNTSPPWRPVLDSTLWTRAEIRPPSEIGGDEEAEKFLYRVAWDIRRRLTPDSPRDLD